MNITPSADPIPMPARDGSGAAPATSSRDRGTTPFSDLLDAPHEQSPDAKPARAAAKVRPREQPADGTDPALALVPPFMLMQAVPVPPAAPEGFARDAGAGDCVGKIQQAVISSVVTGTSKDALAGEAAVPNAATGVVMDDGAKGTDLPKDAVANTASAGASPASQPDGKRTEAGAADCGFPTTITKITVVTESAPVTQSAPAESSPLPSTAAASAIPPTAFSTSRNGISQEETQPVSGTAGAEEIGGMTAAMQRLIMKTQSPERQTRTQAGVAVVSSAPGKLRAADMPEKSSAAGTQTLVGMAFEPQSGGGHAANAPAASEAPIAAEITRQTFDIVERVRTTGRDSAEVRMHLNDGQEVTVSLRLERGEWKPVFKTGSEALCRALEQNWHRVVPQPSGQSAKFGTPVFQSQSAQPGPGGNAQQQSESGGRGRSFHRQEQDAGFENVVPFRATEKPAHGAHVSRFSEAAAMQVYA